MCRGRTPSNITCMISCGKHWHKSKLGTSFNRLSRFTPYSTEKLDESSVFNRSQWRRCWCKFLRRSWAHCNYRNVTYSIGLLCYHHYACKSMHTHTTGFSYYCDL